MAGAPSAEAVRLVELLTSDDAEARHRGYAELESADAAAAATPTVVEALVEGALCSAQVEAAEYRQVCALMGDLMFREEGGFDVELIRQGRWIRAWEAPALLAAANKPPAEMTREDALVVAADLSVLMMTSRGWTHHHQVAGEDEMVTLSKALRHPLYPERAADNPGANERLFELALEVCRDPQGLSKRQLAGVWNCLFFLITMRAELGVVAINGGIFEAAVAELRELEYISAYYLQTEWGR